jgi:MoaA/NifB/PqqE/SkfB family radical SAM enzyme
MQKFNFDIDVTGACNLRCPSCPQGSIMGYRPRHGFMEAQLLEQIIHKAKYECSVVGISLFSWAEPLLHPRICDLIQVVTSAGIPCHMSSNLNLLPQADAIMEENPASLKISLSGFTQDVYGRTHRGGNIELVKKHMSELAAAKKRANATTRIIVNYHRYLHNLEEEPLMRRFAADLGFDFEPAWALLLPVEKILAFSGNDKQPFPLTEEDRQLIDQLALPVTQSLEYSQASRSSECRLRDSQVSMDFQGNVLLCCGIFDARSFTIAHYLDKPLDEIQRARTNHDMCDQCMHAGAHMYLTYAVPHMDELILKTVPARDVELLDLRHEFALKQRHRYLQKIYQKYLSGIITEKQKTAIKTVLHRILHCKDSTTP